MGKLDQVFLNWNMRHRGKVDAPFLSLATHSVCRRGRCSHPSKTTSGSKIRTNVVQETFGHIRLHFQFIFMALSSKTQLPSSWSSKFTHAGVVSGSILVGMRREKSEKVARGPPVVDHHQPTAALCKQLIYAHILCIAGLDYSRTSPGWIIPIYNRDISTDHQAGLSGWIIPNRICDKLFCFGDHIPHICHRHHRRCLWRKILPCGEISDWTQKLSLLNVEKICHMEKFLHIEYFDINLTTSALRCLPRFN